MAILGQKTMKINYKCFHSFLPTISEFTHHNNLHFKISFTPMFGHEASLDQTRCLKCPIDKIMLIYQLLGHLKNKSYSYLEMIVHKGIVVKIIKIFF